MRSHFAVFTSVICLVVLAGGLADGFELDDALAPSIVAEPEDVVIGEEDEAAEDGDVHYEMDWDHDDGHNDFHSRPDSHAPAGLTADHTHKKGEWMVEYKYMYMNMQTMRTGTRSITPIEAVTGAGTAATPIGMNMQMHMGHVMYGLTDCITLYTMLMWNDLSMDHIFQPGGANIPFTTSNSDLDDMRIGAVINLYEGCNTEWIGHLGLVLPTGDIGRVVQNGPPPPPGRFPYPMRTGSGSVSLRPGLTYKKWNDCGSIGVQAMGYIPLNDNYQGYREGAEARVSFWIAGLLNESTSASFRVEGLWLDNIHGADPTLNPAAVTTANPNYQGRSNVNLYGGFNKIICGHRFGFEAGAPVYQNVRGFQLEQDVFLYCSWSKAF